MESYNTEQDISQERDVVQLLIDTKEAKLLDSYLLTNHPKNEPRIHQQSTEIFTQIDISKVALPTADFVIFGGNTLYAIERKKLSDLCSSGGDGRLQDQNERLRELREKFGDLFSNVIPFYVIECSASMMQHHFLECARCSSNFYFKFINGDMKVFNTTNVAGTKMFLNQIARQLSRDIARQQSRLAGEAKGTYVATNHTVELILKKLKKTEAPLFKSNKFEDINLAQTLCISGVGKAVANYLLCENENSYIKLMNRIVNEPSWLSTIKLNGRKIPTKVQDALTNIAKQSISMPSPLIKTVINNTYDNELL